MRTPFGFIGPGHPFYRDIERLRQVVASDPAPCPQTETRSLLRVSFARAEPELKWAYVSRQRRGGHFEATTYLYRASRMRVERFEFPCDPKLEGPASFLKHAVGFEVLRYIPRRRVTMADDKTVIKFVRPTELAAIASRLPLVGERLREISTPRLECVRAEWSAFVQNRLPGTPLSKVLNPSDFEPLLQEAGRRTRRIHAANSAGLPPLAEASQTAASNSDLGIISLFRPDLNGWLSEIARSLSPGVGETVFCHGDLRASHFLVTANEPWSVVDLDGAVRADPLWELALFITSLKREAPEFGSADLHERAAQAYPSGYESEGGSVDRDRLCKFLTAAEIHFLARSFQRDLCTSDLLDQSIGAIRRLSGAPPL